MIRTAIIPLAGRGTRLLPLTAAMPKALLPLVDPSGRIRCVLHWILAEAKAAGVSRVCLIISPGQQAPVEDYLKAAREGGSDDLPGEIAFLTQASPAGFGDAVLQARPFVGANERGFLVLLGDHVYRADPGQAPCVAQVTSAFNRLDAQAVIGMQPVAAEELCRVGVAAGKPVEGEPGLYRCTAIIEKPSVEEAGRRLVTPGLPSGEFLAHCGIYAFGPGIFRHLEAMKSAGRRSAGEIQLTDAQRRLRDEAPDAYYLLRIAGRGLDTGTPSTYAETFAALRRGA